MFICLFTLYIREVNMSEGLRVVRGPDWNLGNKDGGEGHAGTVVHDNNDNTWDIIWDMGCRTQCNAGKNGKYDLRIIDNAPTGARHSCVTCDICKKSRILGTRWKCTVCFDFDLCALCYLQDKHDLNHAFIRFDKETSEGVHVPKRAASQKTKLLGIYPGAEVMRGPDWEYGTQDGGVGSRGVVIDLRSFGSDTGGRNAVKVRWPNDESNVYRLGHKGKVDVECVEPATGGFYYKDHLPLAGAKETATKGNPEMNQSILKIGDKVCVDIPEKALKEVQKGHGGWSLRMTECIGNVGIVKGFQGDDTVEVEYGSDKWQFYAGAVRKVHHIKVGDTVKILENEQKAMLLQKEHGGWEEDMKKSLGKVGKVIKLDSDGDAVVAFGHQAWVFNPACLIPVQGVKPDELHEKQDFSRSTGVAAEEVNAGLARLFAHLVMLDTLGRQTVGAEQVVTAAAQGNLSAVKSLIQQNPKLVNAEYKGLTPLIIASHQGHKEIVEFLLNSKANIDAKDAKGNTALLAALSGKEEQIALFLIERGADVNVVNKDGRTAAHAAAFESLCTPLKQILQKGCNPSLKDDDGDTPLHDAISKKCDRAVALLTNHLKCDMVCTNNNGFNPIQWAALKGHAFAVERILEKVPGIANVAKSDGFTALHIAAINDHKEIASNLILKGKAKINCTDDGGMTPLHLAAIEGYFEMFLQLLGMTTANQNNERFKIACLMIQNGAEIQVRNNRGGTILDVCRNERLRDAVREFIAKTWKSHRY
ncbi:hypothetical protein KUTeg_002677 [Tegillarca granosa]|uniref:RING-type E3 ubiquitin transferase n=1 Tax=Tegillarca granosa TaxID=220873 RepID=A0ABQ9FZE1_TEGGR|nr:hypothetical protein KUTeg_002677 [Tegillarca granosa]